MLREVFTITEKTPTKAFSWLKADATAFTFTILCYPTLPSLMTFMSGTQFYNYLLWVNAPLAKCLNSVLNVKVVVAAFNQEKA